MTLNIPNEVKIAVFDKWINYLSKQDFNELSLLLRRYEPEHAINIVRKHIRERNIKGGLNND